MKFHLLPDAGPLITLAYADSLSLLINPNWHLAIVDMVFEEVTRHSTPTSNQLAQWVQDTNTAIITTKVFERYRADMAQNTDEKHKLKKSNLGELAIQEAMSEFAISSPINTGVFLFEDHKIARASFLLPNNCSKLSTRAFLQALEANGLIESATSIERKAIQPGRNFSQLRFSTS
jgi:hypothetical protein